MIFKKPLFLASLYCGALMSDIGFELLYKKDSGFNVDTDWTLSCDYNPFEHQDCIDSETCYPTKVTLTLCLGDDVTSPEDVLNVLRQLKFVIERFLRLTFIPRNVDGFEKRGTQLKIVIDTKPDDITMAVDEESQIRYVSISNDMFE